MNDLEKIFNKACYEGDMDQVTKFLSQGIDLNETDQNGETLFSRILENLFIDKKPWRYQIAKFFLDQGGDPNILDEDRFGPLTTAMLQMDAELTELLCQFGAKPNEVAGCSDQETLYDWALSDYQYQCGDYTMTFPEEPIEDDKKDVDSWLKYLQRMADTYNLNSPQHLFILRKYGAKTWRELNGDE